VHLHDAEAAVLTDAIFRYALDRVRLDPAPLDHPRTEAELQALAGGSIRPDGVGGLEALRRFAEVLAPACISTDHPRFLAFVPAAPTESAILFDLVVGASCIYAGSWLEGSGAVFAENEALAWLAALAGLPASSGGVFVSGGTAGNLAGLVAARHRWRSADAARARTRGLLVAGAAAHSSIAQAARVMDCDVVTAVGDHRNRTSGESLQAAVDGLAPDDRDRLFAVVVTAGATNTGVVDDLAGAADVAGAARTWLHVDGAYGGAALAAPSARPLFAGVERADSLVVDPHKWLFAPFDCAAILYRDPAAARAAHTQHAEYLDVLTERPEWNPSEYAFHLSRRARGLPLWFSLAAHGTAAYEEAVETTLAVAAAGADLIRAAEHVELVLEPGLSVLVFRRLGWGPTHYAQWSDRELRAGRSFVVPTSWRGETVLRVCIVNPRTSVDDLRTILDSLQ
jgi:L-2,4-diaminobutyrate decarboxylase